MFQPDCESTAVLVHGQTAHGHMRMLLLRCGQAVHGGLSVSSVMCVLNLHLLAP